MLLREIMNQYPTCCSVNTSVAEAARLMHHKDFGFLPVVEDDGRIAGVLTDRDIVCRVIAAGKDPATTTVAACMSRPAVSMVGDADLNACMEAMKRHQIKRMVVVEQANCIGIVSQADLIGHATPEQMGAVVGGIAEAKRLMMAAHDEHIPAG